ncbi:putative membrane protein [Catenulispora sp. MAP12-49]|uniref:hypothetical protein n=1 Tax=Catenulispora sp. MAP12-49 TaxID=3156302 RepID=UPI003517CDE6
MTKFLLSLHVLAAIIAVGPVAVAASMFPRSLRRAHEDSGAVTGLHLLHRVCRVYAGVGIAVPVFGFATASNMHVLGSAWLITAIGLTAVAAGVLALWILPAQQAALAELGTAEPGTAEPGTSEAPPESQGGPAVRTAARLAAATGIFNLLWATVTILMIVRPGSTTGA